MQLLRLLTLFLLAPHLQAQDKPLYERSIENIIHDYTIIGDFNIKPEIRDHSNEIFWRYPIKIPKVMFAMEYFDLNDPKDRQAFPRSDGGGRALEHLNRGRTLFLQGNIDEARRTWLGGRARYGKDYPFHRRNDFFIANAFLELAKTELVQANYNYEQKEVRGHFVNASTFFSWAYGIKKDIPDPLLDRLAPRVYYNLASIYYRYERWSAVFGTLTNALDFLRQTGRKEYRATYRRMMAELFIRNRDYLNAAQELDLALRQDADLDNAGLIFARIGDMYFDLNNFELAEDMYAIAIRIDREKKQVRPWQYILRGESLFWLGKYSLAQKMMSYGLAMTSSPDVKQNISNELQALASIRIADSWLALGKIKKARLAYYQHYQQFPHQETAHIAKLREACLELPYYKGNNIYHARELLGQLKKDEATMPPIAQELIWTCELGSYSLHERNHELVERVKLFYERYPRSEFLKSLVGPLREVQSKKLDDYFQKGDQYGALDFFEKTRSFLFPKIKDKTQSELFVSYANVYQSQKAFEFIDAVELNGDIDYIRLAMVLSEVQQHEESRISAQNERLAKDLMDRKWDIAPDQQAKLFIDRIISSPYGIPHFSWIYNLGKKWVEEDFGAACSVVYPVLQRLRKDDKHINTKAFKRISINFINRYLADILKYETYCGYSVLEFELELFKDQPSFLGKKYLERSFLPVNQVTAGLFYTLGELNYERNEKSLAEQLWKKIVQEGSSELLEVKYAKSRLDRRRTETDKLWE